MQYVVGRKRTRINTQTNKEFEDVSYIISVGRLYGIIQAACSPDTAKKFDSLPEARRYIRLNLDKTWKPEKFNNLVTSSL